jgi:integrase
MNTAVREQNIEVLIQKARGVMALQDKAWATEQQYLGYIRRYLRFTYSIPKSDSSEKKFEAWLTRMVLVDDCSVSAQDVAFAAVVWFYKDVLKKPLQAVNALRASKPKQIRQAVPFDDVCRLIRDVRDVGGYPTNFLVRMLYGRGMRVGEPVALRVKDVIFARNEIFIHGGKNRKDRIIALTPDLIADFQKQLVFARRIFEMDVRNKIPVQLPNQLARKYPEFRFNWHWAWMFPAHRTCNHPRTGDVVRFHMLKDYVQQAVRESRRRLGIFAQPHMLRHSFATHLLDSGINPKALQEAMGHKNFETTAGYCHADAKSVPHPVELMARRASLVSVAPLQPARLEFQNA